MLQHAQLFVRKKLSSYGLIKEISTLFDNDTKEQQYIYFENK